MLTWRSMCITTARLMHRPKGLCRQSLCVSVCRSVCVHTRLYMQVVSWWLASHCYRSPWVCSAVRGWGMSTQLAMCIGVLALYTLHTGVTLRWPNEDSLSWRAGLSQDMQQ